MKITRMCLIFMLIISCNWSHAVEESMLTVRDVQRVMNEIFDQHVDKKEMDAVILKNAFQTYIDHFDPDRIYLTQREVDPFLKISGVNLKKSLEDYKDNNLQTFIKINHVIQAAISRARLYREELMSDLDSLFRNSTKNPYANDLREDDRKRPFAQSVDELKNRIREGMVKFLSAERQRYGDEVVLENTGRSLNAYQQSLLHRENQYTYLDEEGVVLSEKQKENLFVMKVLKALARGLDSHTSFLDASEAYDMKVRLEKGFKGIGVILQRKPEGIVITRLVKGGPAERSGLVKVEDRIVKINNENVKDSPLDVVIDILRDLKGDSVVLVLKRPHANDPKISDETVSVTLARELIEVDEGRVDIDFEPFDNGIIGKLSLHSFYQGENGITSEKDMREALKELKKKGELKGLILDMRNNSGGFLNQAVKVAGLFITNGVVVVSKYSNGEERYYRDMDGKDYFDGPFIILTSKATASAAEIVAQALQDYGSAIIVGDEQTYGKGTIQSQTVTDGKSSSNFKVTVGKYYTTSGKTPQIRGVKADIIVPGYYSRESIGEEYLDFAIKADQIAPSFDDPLTDVDAGVKPWYLRYYMPSIQKKETVWKDALPGLKKSSEERLSLNPGFQKFLNGEWEYNPYTDVEQKIPMDKDFQMQEAIAILKDMMSLDKSSTEKIAGHEK